ncbi:MAG: carboxypeptidase-like regulatory domain-containing protein [Gemmatimonadota bacterium]|nr:carboxypeptidase-like regulatory domain-containing protein [Gemmatimonadota bacterium]
MNVRLKALTIVLGAILLPCVSASQTTGSIRGIAYDTEGRPLEGVEIVVRGIERTVTTNSFGAYRFLDVPAGEQQLTARRPGYRADQRTVVISAGHVALVDFRLQSAPQQLDSVSVTVGLPPPLLLGYVHDTFGRPLEHVEILLQGVNRTVLTSATGAFRFDSLEVKQYQLTARLPGYVAAHSLVPVRAAPPTEVALRLQGFAQDLGTIEVDADRRGIYGVVGTKDLKPVPNAKVQVYGGGTSQRTDSAGRFAFPDLKPGDYLLDAEMKGMTGRSLNVELPRNGRREVVITLAPVNPSVRRVVGEKWIKHDLGLALAFSSSVGRMNRSYLARFTGMQLCDIGQVRNRAGGTEAMVVVDGHKILKPWSLCAFSADELALVSVSGPSPWCTVQGVRVFVPPGLRCVYVWTR